MRKRITILLPEIEIPNVEYDAHYLANQFAVFIQELTNKRIPLVNKETYEESDNDSLVDITLGKDSNNYVGVPKKIK